MRDKLGFSELHEKLVYLCEELPQSAELTAYGPGRKHSLLPALAKNMPQAYFLTRRALCDAGFPKVSVRALGGRAVGASVRCTFLSSRIVRIVRFCKASRLQTKCCHVGASFRGGRCHFPWKMTEGVSHSMNVTFSSDR